MTTDYPVHPVADLFPMMSSAELRELADDIMRDGQIQPVVLLGEQILDGRNRLAACRMAGVAPTFCQYHGESPVAFIISANLRRRHLNQGQKIALGLEIEPYFAEEARKRKAQAPGMPRGVKASLEEIVPQETPGRLPQARDQAAQVVGISGKTLSAAKAIKAKAPEKFAEVIQGRKSLARAQRELRAEDDHAALRIAQDRLDAERRERLASVCDLRVSSCRDLLESGIRPDAVITDPPYPRQFLPVFSELAEACQAAGVPLVAVMSGQSYLPEVLQRMCAHLPYRWTLAYLTPGGQSVQQWQARVNTAWKPVLLFGEAREWFGDVAVSRSNDNDKRFHDWGQSESGMADLIERLTKPGQLICDPFLGGGTTAVVALALGRRFVGGDIDAACVESTRLRVAALDAGAPKEHDMTPTGAAR